MEDEVKPKKQPRHNPYSEEDLRRYTSQRNKKMEQQKQLELKLKQDKAKKIKQNIYKLVQKQKKIVSANVVKVNVTCKFYNPNSLNVIYVLFLMTSQVKPKKQPRPVTHNPVEVRRYMLDR